MTFANAELEQAVSVMSQLNETSPRLAYAIAKNMRKMKDEVQDYVTVKDQALNQYGTALTKDGQPTGQYELRGENLIKYREALGDLPNETIDVDVYQVDEDTFLSGSMNSKQMESLLWMVRENE